MRKSEVGTSLDLDDLCEGIIDELSSVEKHTHLKVLLRQSRILISWLISPFLNIMFLAFGLWSIRLFHHSTTKLPTKISPPRILASCLLVIVSCLKTRNGPFFPRGVGKNPRIVGNYSLFSIQNGFFLRKYIYICI